MSIRENQSLESQVGAFLTRRGQTLATAESCTGGLIAHRLTNIPGASVYFLGGIVAYANAIKVNELGVSQADLDREGAVSETVARQMASGIRQRFQTDIGLATTGIAGPNGGSLEKPVGTVFMAIAAAGEIQVHQGFFPLARVAFKQAVSDALLQYLLTLLA